MSDSPTIMLSEIQQKIARLAASRDEAIERSRMMSVEMEQLRTDLAEREKELQNARLEIEFLTISHKLADNPQAVADARRRISTMIRRLDAAIALIKSDPADL